MGEKKISNNAFTKSGSETVTYILLDNGFTETKCYSWSEADTELNFFILS